MVNNTFKKEERLCSKRLISSLFTNGSSFVFFPYRVMWMRINDPIAPVQILVSVSKRRFHHAVDRNLIKRRIRECYRQQKHILPKVDENDGMLLGIQYIAKDKVDYSLMYRRMGELLAKIIT